ncbi:MAG: two pore domain potassium channel family protein [Bacteroidales bacterium]|nr:two pore domain potassium channel family protein [Bacteroidales bacterium]
MTLSDRIRHFFHVVSNVRPIVWIGLYVILTPIFAFIYWGLPDGQFRIPDGAGTDYGSWLYYSIVTITTLGFGDYTPAHGWAQTVTAVEVMCGLIILGFFLNAVGSMKSEIDVESEIEKQRRIHEADERRKLLRSIPSILHSINQFLAHCYALTTPQEKRQADNDDDSYNPDFKLSDMRDLYAPSGLPSDRSGQSAVVSFLKSASRTSLSLDSLQNRVDLTLWPRLLEDCFAFVANTQMYANDEIYLLSAPVQADVKKRLEEWKEDDNSTQAADMEHYVDLAHFVRQNADLALKIENVLTSLAQTGE